MHLSHFVDQTTLLTSKAHVPQKYVSINSLWCEFNDFQELWYIVPYCWSIINYTTI